MAARPYLSRVQPRGMSLRGLHHSLPLHHPLAGLLVPALGQVSLQYRGCGLLDLQEERVARVAPLEQNDERPGADAAYADHFAGHVHDLEPFQQVPLVILEGGAVGVELFADHGRLRPGKDRRWRPGRAPGPRSVAG